MSHYLPQKWYSTNQGHVLVIKIALHECFAALIMNEDILTLTNILKL